MTDLNRRNTLGLLGSGLTLAACSSGSAANDVRASSKMFAPYPQYGHDPHDKVAMMNPKAPPFKPAFVCAVYIRFDGNNAMIIRHGYFDLSTPTMDMSESAIAGKLLNAAQSAASGDDWKISGYGDKRKEVNFENFHFGQPMRVYVLIDNDNIRFDDRKDSGGVFRNLLRFTRFRVDTGEQKRSGKFKLVEASKNFAFYDATLIEISDYFPKRRILRIDNHYTKEEGKLIKADYNNPKTHHLYSINFHLLWQTADSGNTKEIPMVIDPDGGNMGSRP